MVSVQGARKGNSICHQPWHLQAWLLQRQHLTLNNWSPLAWTGVWLGGTSTGHTTSYLCIISYVALGRRPGTWGSAFSFMKWWRWSFFVLKSLDGRIKLENTGEVLVQNKSLANLCNHPPPLTFFFPPFLQSPVRGWGGHLSPNEWMSSLSERRV